MTRLIQTTQDTAISHRGLNKLQKFCWRHFQVCILEGTFLYFNSNFIELCSWIGSNRHWVSVGSCNDLVASKHQAVTWTNDDPPDPRWDIFVVDTITRMFPPSGGWMAHLHAQILPHRLPEGWDEGRAVALKHFSFFFQIKYVYCAKYFFV